MVMEHGGDEEQAIGALLHDAAEDQGGRDRLDDIEKRFGDRVARIVEACTDSLADTTKGERKPPWRDRKERYIEHIRTMDDDAVLVSLADKTHNARAILRDRRRNGEAIWDRFTASRDETLWYYRNLAAAFQARRACMPAGELAGELANELTDIVSTLARD